MKHTLRAAAAYNILWGAAVITAPHAAFRWMQIPLPNYPSLWQCIGMIVGVYGIGYAIAAENPVRHWPIVLVGLLGKILGPIGFIHTASNGNLPWRFGIINLTNDILWWIPFTLILRFAWKTEKETLRAEQHPADTPQRNRPERHNPQPASAEQ
jgi:hypothetical protein